MRPTPGAMSTEMMESEFHCVVLVDDGPIRLARILSSSPNCSPNNVTIVAPVVGPFE